MAGIPDTRRKGHTLDGVARTRPPSKPSQSSQAEARPLPQSRSGQFLRSPYGFWRVFAFAVAAVIVLILLLIWLKWGVFGFLVAAFFLFRILANHSTNVWYIESESGSEGSLAKIIGGSFVSSRCPDCGLSIFSTGEEWSEQTFSMLRVFSPAKQCQDCGYDLTVPVE